MLQQKQNTQAHSSSFLATLAHICTIVSYIIYVTYLDYRFRATDHMTGNRGIMSSFTLTSNSVVLADSSRTPIQGIDTVAIILLFYRLFFIYLIFLLTYYQSFK